MPTVYITAPPDAADELAETLVEDRLAACVNRLPTTSTYRWDGEVHHDEETVLLAKTTEEVYEDLVTRVQDLHPYDVPCIERFDESHVLESFAEWRGESVAEREAGSDDPRETVTDDDYPN
jgi:periplasmic divalent cation tolerance protein